MVVFLLPDHFGSCQIDHGTKQAMGMLARVDSSLVQTTKALLSMASGKAIARTDKLHGSSTCGVCFRHS